MAQPSQPTSIAHLATRLTFLRCQSVSFPLVLFAVEPPCVVVVSVEPWLDRVPLPPCHRLMRNTRQMARPLWFPFGLASRFRGRSPSRKAVKDCLPNVPSTRDKNRTRHWVVEPVRGKGGLLVAGRPGRVPYSGLVDTARTISAFGS